VLLLKNCRIRPLFFFVKIGTHSNFSISCIWTYQAQKELGGAAKVVQGSKEQKTTIQAQPRPMQSSTKAHRRQGKESVTMAWFAPSLIHA